MPASLTAGLLGLLSGVGLLVGAIAGWSLTARHRTIAVVTAIGVGLLIAVASLYLISSALESVSAAMVALGALAGALGFSLVNLALDRWEAGDRKRCGECVQQPAEGTSPGSGLAIAIGSLLDAVPEALIIGATAATAVLPPLALVGAFALGNFAEGLSSTAGMRPPAEADAMSSCCGPGLHSSPAPPPCLAMRSSPAGVWGRDGWNRSLRERSLLWS